MRTNKVFIVAFAAVLMAAAGAHAKNGRLEDVVAYAVAEVCLEAVENAASLSSLPLAEGYSLAPASQSAEGVETYVLSFGKMLAIVANKVGANCEVRAEDRLAVAKAVDTIEQMVTGPGGFGVTLKYDNAPVVYGRLYSKSVDGGALAVKLDGMQPRSGAGIFIGSVTKLAEQQDGN